MVSAALTLAQQGAAPAAVPASRQADNVAIITLRGEINAITSMSVQRRIRAAEEDGASAIVIEIDSPGGELGAVLEISNAIKGSSVPNTVAWVNPDAYSGGAIIALACREIVVSDPASFGDALPIHFGPEGVQGLTEVERKKLLPPLLADVTDSARRSGFDEYLVQAFVIDGIELWSVRDIETGRQLTINEAEYRMLFNGAPPRGKPVFDSVLGTRASAGSDADASAATPAAEDETVPDAAFDPSAADTPESQRFAAASPSLADLTDDVSFGLEVDSRRPIFSEADRGRYEFIDYVCDGSGPIVMRNEQLDRFGFSAGTIETDAELEAFFGAQHMLRYERSWSEHAVAFMTRGSVRGLLIVLFLLGVFVEMMSPGLVLPGLVAMGSLMGLLGPPMVIGMAGWWEVVAILVGLLLIAAEVFVLPGFGVFGIVGLASLFVGMVGTFVPDSTGFPGQGSATSDALRGVVTILVSFTTAGVLMFFIGRNFGTLPLLNRLVLKTVAGETDPDRESSSVFAAMAPDPEPEVIVGDTGVTTSPLRPSGQAEINDRIVEVVSDLHFVDRGVAVRVVAIEPMRVVVTPDEAGGGSA